VHGAAQAGILALCAWAIALAHFGRRAGALPLWLGLVAVLPLIRLLVLVIGPFGLADDLWIPAVLAIPGTFVWCGLLGLVFARRKVSEAPVPEPR
jgi:hypothetical protein